MLDDVGWTDLQHRLRAHDFLTFEVVATASDLRHLAVGGLLFCRRSPHTAAESRGPAVDSAATPASPTVSPSRPSPMLPVANPSVIFQKLDDGAVLFAPETEIYFGLNTVGASIWELLVPGSRSLDEIYSEVSARYPEVPAPTIRVDVLELLDALVNEGLARRAEPREADAESAS